LRLAILLAALLPAILVVAAPARPAAAIDVAVGGFHACALYDDGAVWCWGAFPGEEPQLPFTAWRVAPLPPAESIAVGRFGACATLLFGELRCWGIDYQRSAMADAPVTTRTPFKVEGLPPVAEVALGYVHHCARTHAGEVWCWGDNPCGELGCGDLLPHAIPRRVPDVTGAISVGAGINNSCAILGSGQLTCWGSDNPTMPGHPFVYESGDPVAFDPRVFGRFADVANGRNFGCGIRRSGAVTCWGSNVLGQLGNADLRLGTPIGGLAEVTGITAATDLDAAPFAACAVEAGAVTCWGQPEWEPVRNAGQAPWQVPGLTGAERVGIGRAFACAVAAGRVLCWGAEEHEGAPLIEGMHPRNPRLVAGLPSRY
jgi:alpha-tubulin suppressor-like RCC1 family protein